MIENKDKKEELEIFLEGKKEELGGTSPLSNTTIPTEEEEENAGLIQNPEVPVPDVDQDGEPVEPTETDPMLDEVAGEQNTQETQNIQSTLDEQDTSTVLDPTLGIAETSTEKMFTQSQVNEIVGKARKEGRERALRETFSRYGVDSEEGLDDLFGDAQRYTTVQEMYDTDKKMWEEQGLARDTELAEVKQRVALLESGIDKERYDDAKFILTGKGLDVTTENILNELATHPEWKRQEQETNSFMSDELASKFKKKVEPATKIDVLGNESYQQEEPGMSDREKAMNMFFRR